MACLGYNLLGSVDEVALDGRERKDQEGKAATRSFLSCGLSEPGAAASRDDLCNMVQGSAFKPATTISDGSLGTGWVFSNLFSS